MDIKLKNVVNHTKTVLTHKWWVFYYCTKLGMPWRGFMHDMSKFSPTEFLESVKYYTGTSSPIDACKKAQGYSMGWIHHRTRNPHHYEHWTDNYDTGVTSVMMPFKYLVEMLCDYLAAGRVYNGTSMWMDSEYEWWCKKRETAKSMHPKTKAFIDVCITTLYKRCITLNMNTIWSIYCMVVRDIPATRIIRLLEQFGDMRVGVIRNTIAFERQFSNARRVYCLCDKDSCTVLYTHDDHRDIYYKKFDENDNLIRYRGNDGNWRKEYYPNTNLIKKHEDDEKIIEYNYRICGGYSADVTYFDSGKRIHIEYDDDGKEISRLLIVQDAEDCVDDAESNEEV